MVMDQETSLFNMGFGIGGEGSSTSSVGGYGV